VYTDDIFIAADRPLFVYWDSNTKNTPFKAGLTDCQEGFAFRHGAWENYMTVVCFVKNGSRMWIWSKIKSNWIEFVSKDDLRASINARVDSRLKIEWSNDPVGFLITVDKNNKFLIPSSAMTKIS